MPEPEMRTIAPNTRCVKATASATYENRRSVEIETIKSGSSLNAAPGRQQNGSENEGGDDSPGDLHHATPVGLDPARVRTAAEHRSQNRRMRDEAANRGDPEKQLGVRNGHESWTSFTSGAER